MSIFLDDCLRLHEILSFVQFIFVICCHQQRMRTWYTFFRIYLMEYTTYTQPFTVYHIQFDDARAHCYIKSTNKHVLHPRLPQSMRNRFIGTVELVRYHFNGNEIRSNNSINVYMIGQNKRHIDKNTHKKEDRHLIWLLLQKKSWLFWIVEVGCKILIVIAILIRLIIIIIIATGIIDIFYSLFDIPFNFLLSLHNNVSISPHLKYFMK